MILVASGLLFMIKLIYIFECVHLQISMPGIVRELEEDSFESGIRMLNAFEASLHPRTHRPELPRNCVEAGATSVIEAVELILKLLLNALVTVPKILPAFIALMPSLLVL